MTKDDLEADRKMFARVSEIDEVMNKVKRCSRLCGKGKDGLSYLWYGETIRAMKEALELLGYKVTKQTEPKDDLFDYCPRCGMRILSKWYKPKGEE